MYEPVSRNSGVGGVALGVDVASLRQVDGHEAAVAEGPVGNQPRGRKEVNVEQLFDQVGADGDFIDPFAQKKRFDEPQVTGEQRAVDRSVTGRVVVQEVQLVLNHLLRANPEAFLLPQTHVTQQIGSEVKVFGALGQDGVADTSGFAGRHPEGNRRLHDHLRQELLRGQEAMRRLGVARIAVQVQSSGG